MAAAAKREAAVRKRQVRGRGGPPRDDDDGDEAVPRYIDSSKVAGVGGDFDAMTPAEACAAIREIWDSPYASFVLTRDKHS
jgi:hypothetical protein